MLDDPREAGAWWFGEHMTAAELADVARYVGELEHAGSMLGELPAVLALARRPKRRQAREALMARRPRAASAAGALTAAAKGKVTSFLALCDFHSATR
jgi:hypothetical protein